jgi:polyvinyl alcohol dehydrogenase (cytochrome)
MGRFGLSTAGLAAALIFAIVAFPQAQAPRGQAPAAGRGGFLGPNIAGTESGWATYQSQCYGCHGNATPNGVPSAYDIRKMTPDRINAALANADHHGKMLTDVQALRVAEFMSSRPLGSVDMGDASMMPNRCTANPPMGDPANASAWNGWGNGPENHRFQAAERAKLAPADVPRLTLKWAFGYPHGETNNAQPTVAGGRVFAGSDNGYIYALDAKTGCVYWSFQQGSIIRNAPAVGAVNGQGAARFAVFFGDGHANVYALDAQTGRQLWKTKVDDHVVARITAGVKYYDGRVYVPVSGSEEFNAGQVDYPCCTGRGSVVALDASTGTQIWKTYDVPQEPKPWKKNPNGVQLYGPAGGGIWDSPTIDPVRGALYIGTGDAVTPPGSPYTDGVMAMDLKTGTVLWSYQATPNDLFMGGCAGPTHSEACPSPMGPDMDIGNSPMLVTLPGGKRAVIAGTKRADVVALDPDDHGKLLYRINTAGQPVNGGRGRGSIMWGGAADAQHVYYGTGAAGLAALTPASGAVTWTFNAPGIGGRGNAAFGAAPTVIPGVVFEGAADGRLFAVSAADGRQLWEFNTSQMFDTVNKVPAHGGSINTSGAVVADGMVFVGSGYAISSGAAGGNVLLAFGVE